jgi:hypothetical protein
LVCQKIAINHNEHDGKKNDEAWSVGSFADGRGKVQKNIGFVVPWDLLRGMSVVVVVV